MLTLFTLQCNWTELNYSQLHVLKGVWKYTPFTSSCLFKHKIADYLCKLAVKIYCQLDETNENAAGPFIAQRLLYHDLHPPAKGLLFSMHWIHCFIYINIDTLTCDNWSLGSSRNKLCALTYHYRSWYVDVHHPIVFTLSFGFADKLKQTRYQCHIETQVPWDRRHNVTNQLTSLRDLFHADWFKTTGLMGYWTTSRSLQIDWQVAGKFGKMVTRE